MFDAVGLDIRYPASLMRVDIARSGISGDPVGEWMSERVLKFSPFVSLWFHGLKILVSKTGCERDERAERNGGEYHLRTRNEITLIAALYRSPGYA
jgi:hypothetical protein